MFESDTALLVIDVQNDFVTGGALAVPDGDAVVPLINRVAQSFGRVVLTQDWHPVGHASFASGYSDQQVFDVITLPEVGPQVLWPDHCVQDTPGAAFHPDLQIPHAQLVLRKGCHPRVDSYSAFMEADRRTLTGLAAYLQVHGVRRVVLCGLALDYCVAWSAMDARAAGFETVVLQDACRAIDARGSLAQALSDMLRAGVALHDSAEFVGAGV